MRRGGVSPPKTPTATFFFHFSFFFFFYFFFFLFKLKEIHVSRGERTHARKSVFNERRHSWSRTKQPTLCTRFCTKIKPAVINGARNANTSGAGASSSVNRQPIQISRLSRRALPRPATAWYNPSRLYSIQRVKSLILSIPWEILAQPALRRALPALSQFTYLPRGVIAATTNAEEIELQHHATRFCSLRDLPILQITASNGWLFGPSWETTKMINIDQPNIFVTVYFCWLEWLKCINA